MLRQNERKIKVAAAKKSGGSKTGRTKKTTDAKNTKAQTENPKPQTANDQVHQFRSIILFALGILVFLLTIIDGSSGWNAIHHVLR